MEIIYFGMMEEERQILLLDFGDVPGDRPARLEYIQLTIGLLIESMITHIWSKAEGSSDISTRKRQTYDHLQH